MTRRRLRPDCLSVLGCLAIVAASVWIVVRSVTAWITGHPEVVAAAVAFACMGGVGAGRWSDRREAARAVRLVSRRAFLDLTPGEFEQAVAGLCWRDGCTDVRVVGGAGDLAADVLATVPDRRRVLIQCKRYAPPNPVRSPEVQQVGGTYQLVHGADVAVVVTTSVFTAEAVRYAHRAGIRLVGGDGLAAWARGGRPPWE